MCVMCWILYTNCLPFEKSLVPTEYLPKINKMIVEMTEKCEWTANPHLYFHLILALQWKQPSRDSSLFLLSMNKELKYLYLENRLKKPETITQAHVVTAVWMKVIIALLLFLKILIGKLILLFTYAHVLSAQSNDIWWKSPTI